MRTLKIFATASATASGAAQVTIPNRGTIRAVQWAVRLNSITDGAQLDLEISRSSAYEIAVNGAQQSISEVAFEGNFVTSGLAQNGINLWVPVNISVDQGQIIYLHARVAGTLTYTATAILHY